MSKTAEELVQEYNIEAELIEALLLRYGGAIDKPTIDNLTPTHRLVYQFLENDEDSPIRTAEDHFYQFNNHSEYSQKSNSPGVESAFEAILSDLVAEGLVAQTNEELPRYSTSFYDLLAEIDRDWTVSEIDQFCAETGVDKCQLYYHILTSLHLNVNLTE